MLDLNPFVEMSESELQERLAALEFAMESAEWRVVSAQGDQEFSRGGLTSVTEISRLMFLKNPMIKRGVLVKRDYVFGQGWAIHAQEPAIQATIDAFLYDQKNDDVFGSHEARLQLEIELQTDGNWFFCFFINAVTGQLRIRTISFDQIDDVLYNPDDSKEPWYYLRRWTETRVNMSDGSTEAVVRAAFYPDWRYKPTAQPKHIGDWPVYWDRPLYHVKVGGFSNWKFGISEIYDAIDWARAYKSFLEDWASIVRAYRKFAFQLTAPSSKAVSGIRGKIGNGSEANGNAVAPPITGSIFAATEGYNLQAVKTSGATVSADDGRRLQLMVAASFGLPETFFGDASVGSLATAESLDRPTELMMQNRQQLWRDVTLNIINFVELWAIKAPQGALRSLGRVETTVENGQKTEAIVWNEGVNDDVAVAFPPLVQHNAAAMVAATVNAATLGQAGVLAGTIDLPTLSAILLTQLGISDADEIVERLFPDGEPVEQIGPRPVAEAMMIEAVKELRNALVNLRS
jgi:hypothetical protein